LIMIIPPSLVASAINAGASTPASKRDYDVGV
jgi:hypothetical protein